LSRRAAADMATSAVGFSVMAMLAKLAARELPTGEIVLARALLTLGLSFWLVRRAGLAPWGTRRLGLAFRGLLGSSGLAFYYLSLVRLPLAEATTLQNVVPVITALLAWRVLGERIGWAAAFALACGVGGGLRVARPCSHASGDSVGVACALAAAVSSATAYVTVRELSKTEHPLVIVFYFPLVATPLAVPWALTNLVAPSLTGCVLLVGIGVATQVGQVIMTKGLALARAGRAPASGYLQIVFASGWQLAVFADAPSSWTLAGASATGARD